MLTARRAALASMLLVPVAVAIFLFLRGGEPRDRIRFALYRPSAAQFYLDRSIERGEGLDYTHVAVEVVELGAPGDTGLSCPQSDPAAPGRFRTFANGAWVTSATKARPPGSNFTFGQAGDLPFCADFDGDGLSDSGVFRDGTWFVSARRDGAAPIRFSFGTVGDRPVVLNVKGAGNGTDRRDVVYGVYSRGMWYLDTHGTGTVDAAHVFGGLPQDVPLLIPRWSREGAATPGYSLAIFRDGTWYLKPDPDGAQILSFGFGAAGDLPGFVR